MRTISLRRIQQSLFNFGEQMRLIFVFSSNPGFRFASPGATNIPLLRSLNPTIRLVQEVAKQNS